MDRFGRYFDGWVKVQVKVQVKRSGAANDPKSSGRLFKTIKILIFCLRNRKQQDVSKVKDHTF